MEANSSHEAASSQANSSQADVGIEWKTISGRECLFFKFGPYLTEDSAKIAAERWKDEFNKKPGKSIVIVWECLDMKGYDKQARIIWQDTMNEYKKRIDGIYIITKSSLISAGAHFMGIFVGIKITGITSVDDLENRLSGVWSK